MKSGQDDDDVISYHMHAHAQTRNDTYSRCIHTKSSMIFKKIMFALGSCNLLHCFSQFAGY